MAVISGTAIGADASSRYLRYLRVRPVGSTRVYLAKLAAPLVFGLG